MTDQQGKIKHTRSDGPPLPLYGMEEENIPSHIGRFRILGVIGKSQGVVYKAEQDDPHRIVALKIPRGGSLASREARERFRREIALAANLDHAGIVPVFEADEIQGLPYYTMPFIDGESLEQYIEKAKLDQNGRLDLFLRVCNVVQALHAANLVHRDIKPENIMIDRHGDVRLLDFGLARACEQEGAERLTSDSAILGTLQFMAPEQAQEGGLRQIAPATDVYALGVIFYWLLAGVYPYTVDGSREAVARNVREAQPRPPSKVRPDVTLAYDDIVLRALQKEPARRYRNAGELAAALRSVGLGGGVHAQPSHRGVMGLVLLTGGVLAVVLGIVFGFRALTGPPLSPRTTPRQSVRPANQEGLVTGRAKPPAEPEDKASGRAGTDGGSTGRFAMPAGPAAGGAKPSAFVGPTADKLAEPSAQVFTTEEIAGIARTGQPDSESPVPVELWPVYEKTLAALRDAFALRQSGAVLVSAKSRPGATEGHLTWWLGDGQSQEKSVSPGGAVVFYSLDKTECRFEFIAGGNVIRKTVRVRQGEVAYCEL